MSGVLAVVGEGDLVPRGFMVLSSWKETRGMEASLGDR